MRITWTTDCDAPCCPGMIVADDGREILVQSDWDYPGTADTFGWSARSIQRCRQCGHVATDVDCGRLWECPECGHGGEACDHGPTDGTVDCPLCGVSAGDFITAAGDWLRDNDGAETDDPGYFEDD